MASRSRNVKEKKAGKCWDRARTHDFERARKYVTNTWRNTLVGLRRVIYFVDIQKYNLFLEEASLARGQQDHELVQVTGESTTRGITLRHDVLARIYSILLYTSNVRRSCLSVPDRR